MKKTTTVLCVLLMLFSLCACTQNTQNMTSPAKFYYCNDRISYHSEQGVICPETRETALINSDLKTLLNSYFAGPVSKELYSPYPADASVYDLIIYDDIVHVILNDAFTRLNGVDLSIALSCLSMTVMEYTGISSVQISIHNNTIYGKSSLILNRNKLLLVDSSAPVN